LGLGGSDELGLLVVVEDHSQPQTLTQALGFGLDVDQTPAQGVGVASGSGGAQDNRDGVGFTVQGLAEDATLVGQSGDIAVTATEDGMGAGDPLAGG
jgi:hypothetical protein